MFFSVYGRLDLHFPKVCNIDVYIMVLSALNIYNLVGGFNPKLKNMLVKLDHFPRDRGTNKKRNHHPVTYMYTQKPEWTIGDRLLLTILSFERIQFVHPATISIFCCCLPREKKTKQKLDRPDVVSLALAWWSQHLCQLWHSPGCGRSKVSFQATKKRDLMEIRQFINVHSFLTYPLHTRNEYIYI